MYAPVPPMDCERYQDLSELGWFGSEAQPWAAAEHGGQLDNMMHPKGSNELALERCIDYNVNGLGGSFYTMTRTDSMEEVKAVTAPMEVVPMRLHERLQVKDLVKTEYEEVAYEEVDADCGAGQEFDPDLPKVDPESLLFDSPDLLSELDGRDLIDYIISDGSPRPAESPRSLHTPPPSTQPRLHNTPTRAHIPPPRSITPPPPPKKQAMKSTYLAIPRELTAGSNDDKKIPKMLILKTPQNQSTINFQDMAHQIGMSIAERIKTAGKRPRPKRYSDTDDEDEQQEAEGESEEEAGPSKRSRRLSTTSSASTSDRYRELRDKNNEASRKSRQNRKEKEKDLMKNMDATERENVRLRARADELEKLVLSLRKLLLQIVVSKGSAR